MAGMLREREPGRHARVTFCELFFDLVFVFAVTQISHGLLAHLDPMGFLQAGLLVLAVWWAWIYTTWATNWLNPDHPTVRLMLFVLMGVGLILSTSISAAFEARGLVFAAAYVVFQVGRVLFMVWALRDEPVLERNFQRIAIWMVASGVLWIAGGLEEGLVRIGFWAAALAIDYAGPALAYRTPLLGRAATHEWNVEGSHMAERCGLFIIICLGESILVTGASLDDLTWTTPVLVAFGSAFVGSLAMWWIYFSVHAEAASEVISHSGDPGRIARLAYTYIHILIVAGIILAAAGDEMILAHPEGHASPALTAAVLGGAGLYLVGLLLFKRAIFGVWSPTRLGGLAALAAIFPSAEALSPLAVSIAATAVLVGVAVGDAVVLARQARRNAAAQEA